MMGHPLRQDRAAAAYDAGDPLRYQRQVLDEHAGVDRHVVHALRGLLLDHFQHDVGVEVFQPLDAGDRLVNRHRPNRHRRVPQDGLADLVDVAARGKVHDRVGAVMHRGVQLAQLFVDVGGDRGIADVGVDLALGRHPDGHGLQLRMIDVGRDNHPSGGDFLAHHLGRDPLPLRDEHHLFGDLALARVVHLGKIAVAAARRFLPALADPFRSRGFWIHAAGFVSVSVVVCVTHGVGRLLPKPILYPGVRSVHPRPESQHPVMLTRNSAPGTVSSVGSSYA